jgi:hypothetical protein
MLQVSTVVTTYGIPGCYSNTTSQNSELVCGYYEAPPSIAMLAKWYILPPNFFELVSYEDNVQNFKHAV